MTPLNFIIKNIVTFFYADADIEYFNYLLDLDVSRSFFLGEFFRTGTDFYLSSFYVVGNNFYIGSTLLNQWIIHFYHSSFIANTFLILYSFSNLIVLFNFNYEFPNSDLLNITNLYLYIILIEICILIPIVYIIYFLLEPDNFFYAFFKKKSKKTVSEIVYGTFSAISKNIGPFAPYLRIRIAEDRWETHNRHPSIYDASRVEPILPTISIGIGKKLESFLDFFFLILPTILILAILIPSLGLLYNNEFELDNLKYSFIIDVIGHQWYWTYQYKLNNWDLFDFNFSIKDPFDSILVLDSLPRLLVTDNPLVIPSYTNILLVITSADVIHSWSLPSAGLKIDAIPGRMATANLFLLTETYYYGQCSELCGVNHAFMPIAVRVLDKHLFFSFLVDIDYNKILDWDENSAYLSKHPLQHKLSHMKHVAKTGVDAIEKPTNIVKVDPNKKYYEDDDDDNYTGFNRLYDELSEYRKAIVFTLRYNFLLDQGPVINWGEPSDSESVPSELSPLQKRRYFHVEPDYVPNTRIDISYEDFSKMIRKNLTFEQFLKRKLEKATEEE